MTHSYFKIDKPNLMNTNRLNYKPIATALKIMWSLAFVLLIQTWATSQVFNGNTLNTAGNSLIPSAGTGGCTVAPQNTGGTNFIAPVAGLAPGATLLSVRVNFTHTFDADVD